MTTSIAATQAPAVGCCRVVNHNMGKTSMGDVDDSTDTTPTLPPDKAYNTSVIPTAIARIPLAAVRQNIALVSLFCALNIDVGNSNNSISMITETATLNVETAIGSAPASNAGLTRIAPTPDKMQRSGP